MNNKIKVIKRNGVSRNAYGYRNFDNFRNNIYANELSLICDQRYDENYMKREVKIILENI